MRDVSYADRYREAIAAFADPPAATDATPADEIAEGESRLGVKLPEAVRAYYLTAGRLNWLNRAHNRLYAPSQWFIHEDRLVFMEENQAVLYWGVKIDEAADDPAVYQGINLGSKAIEWHLEEAGCAEFLVVMLHWQAVCGGLERMGMAKITPENLASIHTRWSPAGTLKGGMQAFTQRGDVACVIGEGEDLEIFAASRSEEAFERLERRLMRMDIHLSHG
jgi:hypothetical protein